MPLRYDLQPMRDYRLARAYAWDPQQIVLDDDARDWPSLAPAEREILLRLLSMFVAGEEAVASDLAPLLWVVGRQGGLREEEMFLTTQLHDESQHVEFFNRWFETVPGPVDHSRFWGPAYRRLFFDELPRALEALLHDPSATAMARAVMLYHITTEGVLAETGYFAAQLACSRRQVLPGLRVGFEFIKRDESRHIAYGLYRLQRLLQADAQLWPFMTDTLNELLGGALEIIGEALEPYGDEIPFGISLPEMLTYAGEQFDLRMRVLERARA